MIVSTYFSSFCVISDQVFSAAPAVLAAHAVSALFDTVLLVVPFRADILVILAKFDNRDKP